MRKVACDAFCTFDWPAAAVPAWSCSGLRSVTATRVSPAAAKAEAAGRGGPRRGFPSASSDSSCGKNHSFTNSTEKVMRRTEKPSSEFCENCAPYCDVLKVYWLTIVLHFWWAMEHFAGDSPNSEDDFSIIGSRQAESLCTVHSR